MNNIIFLNHQEKQCGVYQYGKHSAEILKKSSIYNFIYIETGSEQEYQQAIDTYHPIGAIYNYHPSTMTWLSHQNIIHNQNQVHYVLHHEGGRPSHLPFNQYLLVDSTYHETYQRYPIPRPLFENTNLNYQNNEIPVISSFGFGFGNKGFRVLVKLVNEQFDRAIIRLHIPRAYFGDRDGKTSAQIFPGCYDENIKPGIELQITTDFLDDQSLLQFLASSSINVFLYDEMKGRGLSSVIDYALSVNVPIAITKSDMFRHIKHASPSICVEDRSLADIIASGTQPLQQFREKWSHANFIKKYEQIIDKTKRQP